MVFFIQLKNEDNIITDIISFPKKGYKQINVQLPLPNGVIGGWYRYIDNSFSFDEKLFKLLNPNMLESVGKV